MVRQEIKRFFSLFIFSFLAPVFAADNPPQNLNLGRVAVGVQTINKVVGGECALPNPGSDVLPPKDIYSVNGVLKASLSYFASLDAQNRTLFCFVTPEGDVAPTYHLKPGDVFSLAVTNRVPVGMVMETLKTSCGESVMYDSSMNLHFHGLLVSPQCTKDDVVDTVINSGDTFQFKINIPKNEPPGLYWYHPHLHGLAEAALLGGASGAIVIDGIENFEPSLVGLPQRVLVMRDAEIVHSANLPGQVDVNGVITPTWDISLNHVPISYDVGLPLTPAVIEMEAGQPELWRVVNAAADSILDFQILYDGIPQDLKIVALDGVPVGSQDGKRLAKPIFRKTIAMPPAARAEFVLNPPKPNVNVAVMQTIAIDAGPVGDSDPSRTMAIIKTSRRGTTLAITPAATKVWPQRFEGVDAVPISIKRKLYFSEILSNPADPSSPTDFFITEDGKTPVKYRQGIAPAIITKEGNVEEWTIENRSLEKHVFHIHQIHFKLEEVNGLKLSADEAQLHDDYTIDYWKGPGFPYPSIKVKMDFRGPIAGDFVYHCHILGHEDNGMMAIIRVLPKSSD
jgi:FtsP/CotA-like multicopper oxidase with cupredoxin domain